MWDPIIASDAAVILSTMIALITCYHVFDSALYHLTECHIVRGIATLAIGLTVVYVILYFILFVVELHATIT